MGSLFAENGRSSSVRLRLPQHILRVGPGHTLSRPSMAALIAQDGDIVEIEAATYDGDAAVWRQNNLTLRGIGGRAVLRANGASAEGKAIWVIKGSGAIVENIEFVGSTVADGNGAGIRQEGAGLIIRNCYFHHNQNGILTGQNPLSDILIESSEFAENGNRDGYTHNIYIGTVKSFTLQYSYVHHVRVGHNVKSRAPSTRILYNRIMDEKTGNGSYQIDLPNGGLSYIIGNLVQKGPRAENAAFVSYGAEGITHSVNQLFVVNNSFVNDQAWGGQFIKLKAQPAVARLVNNIFVGRGKILQDGTAEQSHNLVSRNPGFKDRTHFDYRLIARSPAIDAAIDPGTADGFDLRPMEEYVAKTGKRTRRIVGAVDIGAYEYNEQE